MISVTQFFRLAALCGLVMSGSAGVAAEILIGQTSGFTGPVATSVKETTDGARLYFNAVNARGGVNGQQIKLISLDDQFDVPLARKNVQELITEKNVVALMMNRGTPHTEGFISLLNEYRVPLVAPSTGAMVLHKPVQPYVFNVRASYQREVERALQHLNSIGVSRFAFIHVDDSFGSDAALGAKKGFTAIQKTPVFQDKFDRAKPDFSVIVPRLVKVDPQAVILVGSAQAVADGIKAIRDAGLRSQIVTLSNNASEGFVKLLSGNGNARGIIITQVFPYERSVAALMVKEAMDLAKAKGEEGVSPAMMEGFAGAKVLVEGLRRAGRNPTRESLVAALNSLRKFDLGGMEISYSPEDHTGLDFVDLSIIDASGKFRR